MSDKRVETAVNWAADVQALSPEPVDLEEPATAVLKAGDLARHTARDLGMAFETEPSAFIKLLNDLAPDHDG